VTKVASARTCEMLYPQHAAPRERQMLCTGVCGECDVFNPYVRKYGERATPIPEGFVADSARYEERLRPQA
jgi:hypothetical protein